jgi:hypothetical protein
MRQADPAAGTPSASAVMDLAAIDPAGGHPVQ